MIVYKKHIDEYIMCPYLFGANILSSKQNIIKLSDMSSKLKKHIIELACFEMQNNSKFSIIEYRTKFTNKHYKRPSQAPTAERIVPKLNTIFEAFANNTFIGYNTPIDISLPGTSVTFRDIVDFILSDEDGNITVVEIENIDDFDKFKHKLKYWPQYFTPYSYLAAQFNKKVTLKIIDPVTFSVIDATYLPDRFDDDLSQLRDLGAAMSAPSLVRNLYNCVSCERKESCL